MALVSNNLQIRLSGTDQLETLPSVYVRFNASFAFIQSIADGDGAGEAENIAAVVANATTGGTTYDLTAFPGPFDNTLTFTAIKAILLYNQSVTAGEGIVVGAASTTPFVGPLGGTTPTITVLPGNAIALTNFSAAGWSTSGATNLKLTALAGAPKYTLYIVGLT